MIGGGAFAATPAVPAPPLSITNLSSSSTSFCVCGSTTESVTQLSVASANLALGGSSRAVVRAFLAGTSVLHPAEGTTESCSSRRLRELVPGSNAPSCIGSGPSRAPSSCLIGSISATLPARASGEDFCARAVGVAVFVCQHASLVCVITPDEQDKIDLSYLSIYLSTNNTRAPCSKAEQTHSLSRSLPASSRPSRVDAFPQSNALCLRARIPRRN